MSARPSRVGARRVAAVAPAPSPSRILGQASWQRHLLALLVLLVALSAVFPELVLQGKVLTSPDYDSPSHFADVGRVALRAGEYPLWNPYLFLGMPSYASLAFTPHVYPFSDLLSLLGKLPLAPPMLWLLFYYMAAGYGVFLLARDLGCGFWPSLLGGAAFMLTPHLASMGVFGHGSKLASVAYLPYLALLSLRLRRPGRRPLWAALLGLALGLQLLRGHPQIAFYGLLMLGILAVAEVVAVARRGRGAWAELGRFGAGLAGGVGLGFGIAAVLLLPIHAYAPESIRGATQAGGVAYQYATNWSLAPSEVATFFLPSAAGFGGPTYVGSMPFTDFPNYLGQAVLLFGVAALVLLRGRLLITLLAIAGLALLVSFGKNMPVVYNVLYHHLPYFNKFRVPVMILVLLQLAAALGAALGATALGGERPADLDWRRVPERREALRAFLAAAAAAIVLALAVQPWSAALAGRVAANPRLSPEGRSAYGEVARGLLQGDGLRVGFFLVACAGCVLLLWQRRLPADAAGAMLVAFTVFDLGVVDRRMVAPQHTWPGLESRVGDKRRGAAPPTDVVRWLEQQPRDGAAPLRILPLGQLFMDNSYMSYGIASAGGYHPAKLARFENLVDTQQAAARGLDPSLLDLFAVSFVVTPERVGGWPAPAFAGEGGVVYANPRALPRAWVTGRWRRAASGDCRASLLAAGFDVAHEVLLETTPVPAPDSTAAGTARITVFTAGRVELEVETSAPGLVVVSEAYHPDWRARVDGRPAPVLAADCVLRAVPVPRGASKVVLQFTAPALGAGLAVSLLSLAVVLALLVLGGRRRPRPPLGAAVAREVPVP